MAVQVPDDGANEMEMEMETLFDKYFPRIADDPGDAHWFEPGSEMSCVFERYSIPANEADLVPQELKEYSLTPRMLMNAIWRNVDERAFVQLELDDQLGITGDYFATDGFAERFVLPYRDVFDPAYRQNFSDEGVSRCKGRLKVAKMLHDKGALEDAARMLHELLVIESWPGSAVQDSRTSIAFDVASHWENVVKFSRNKSIHVKIVNELQAALKDFLKWGLDRPSVEAAISGGCHRWRLPSVKAAGISI